MPSAGMQVYEENSGVAKQVYEQHKKKLSTVQSLKNDEKTAVYCQCRYKSNSEEDK